MKTNFDHKAKKPFLTESYECYFPMHYVIDIGNVCNLKCPFCFTGVKSPGIKRDLMSLDSFRIIFDKIKPYAKHIDLYNWGEPFLNKDVLQMFSLCSEHKIHSHIDCTLSSLDLTDEYAEDIVRSGISSMLISMDGITQATYEKYRVGAKLDRVLRNIDKLMKAKERLNMVTPKIGWSYYIHKYNEHEIEKAQLVAKELGINIWFKLLACSEDWKSSLHRNPTNILNIPSWVKEHYPLPHHHEFQELQFHDNVKKVMSACRQPFQTMTINWDGSVTPCTAVTGKEFLMGNLLNNELQDVWNNLAFRKSREFLINYGSKQNTCSVCEQQACPLSQKFY